MSAVLIFSVFLLAIALSLPIGISMILGATAPIALFHQGGTMGQVLHNAFSGANSTPILAVPLFILGGVIMAKGGISRKLFNFFAFFAGRIPGGLPCAVILTCLFYGAISGSGPATTAAVGAMCVPFLTELGYDKTWSAGLVAVAGGLGVIIPPSIPFVLYSLATGVSTGKLFLAGIIPGLLIGLALMVYAVIYCLRNGEDKEKVRERMAELAQQRREKQPLQYPSAGSTFKRPQGYFAGKLIEDAGLRGYGMGGARVSEKHCGFVINGGNATASDVMALCGHIRKTVLEQSGVELEMEVKRWGEF